MILICDAVGLNDDQLRYIQTVLQYSELITCCNNKNTDVYANLAHASICIEQHLLEANTYTVDSKYTSIFIIFDKFINDIDNINSFLYRMRTDEIIFPSQNPTNNCSWVAGHPLAIIKFLSGILDLKDFKWPETVKTGWGNPFNFIVPSYTNMFLHWAHRIKLKVGTLQ